jgi:hypothetical protein
MTEGPSGAERDFWGSDRMSEVPYGKDSVEHETNKQTKPSGTNRATTHGRCNDAIRPARGTAAPQQSASDAGGTLGYSRVL